MPQFFVAAVTGQRVQFGPNNQQSSPGLNARNVIMIAQSTLDGASVSKANSAPVYIGKDSAANKQPIAFNPSDERTWQAPAGMRFDLTQWYLAGATGDGLVVIYE